MMFLLLAGAQNKIWATDVTYHILTLPIPDPSVPENYNYHMTSAVTGKRLEAVKVVVKGQTQLELPAHFKSPLVPENGFKYYAKTDVTKSGSAIKLFDATNNTHKGFTYVVRGEDTPNDDTDDATPVAEKTAVTGNTAEYYVVYTYDASNTIAQLNGSVKYNLSVKNKGFFSLNRGRSNRPAAMPKAKVDAEMLASEEFVYIYNPGSGIVTYWNDNNNKNKETEVGSQFHFIFQFEGVDPYNIIIRTAYDKNTTYIEKNDNSKPDEFVYKYYKEGSFFTNGTNKGYFASDEHRHYNYTYDSSLAENPTDLTEGEAGTHTGWDARTGYYHGQNSAMWNSFALLYNSDKSGYVFMGTRTVDGNGNVPNPTNDGKYYYLKTDNNDFFITQQTTADVSKNYTIEGIYPIKPVTFKVKTPFYAIAAIDAHIVSATANISQYTIDNDDIDDKFIPNELRRKYCTFTTTYRNSDGEVITKYSQMKSDGVIFLEYNVSKESLPFKAITPASSYDADTWKAATWYELTDDRSTQADGKKLMFNSPNFKNNGDADDYAKTSEFAFIGDPYELLVVYRDATQAPANTTHVPYYVGVGTLSTGEDLTTNTTASAGYKWEIPYDATAGSFLLRNYKDANKGYWRWDTDHVNETRSYGTKSGQTVNVVNSEAQTITLNITDFAGGDGNYFKITAGEGDTGQIDSSNPVLSTGMGDIHGTSGTATITLKSSGGAAKSFTLSIQEYNLDNVAQGDPCVITISQGTEPYTGHNVEYSTAGATRIKLMQLPKRNFTYNIVDKAGHIAIKATVSQTIFSPLNGYASIPEVIRSPFLADETVTFYDSYTDRNGDGYVNRKDWNADPEHDPAIVAQTPITEIYTGNPLSNTDIYVKYTTENLGNKSIHLNADEEKQKFNVKLNGSYIYYEDGEIKSNKDATAEDLAKDPYIWCLRNRDPYNMLIDNVARRPSTEPLKEDVTIYDDNGGTTTASKDKGGWVRVADGTWGNDKSLVFTNTRTEASPFIAMMSNYVGVYEVMAATGDDTYYHIGRTTDTKIYSVNTPDYAHNDDALRFELFGKNPIIYHLIDKAKNDLLQVTSNNPRLALPAEYVSPLVGTYYYYPTEELAKADVDNGLHTGNITEPDKITDAGNNVWVTYTVNDLIGFNNSGRIDDHPYLLRFLQPFEEGYYLEDGNDKLTTTKLKAIYPYCNGDGNLNIYGEKMRNEQMDGGSSTRSRWVWFFESANNDPYHVRLHSRNTIDYKGVKNPTYLQTSVVQFKQDLGNNHIVTGGALPGIASEQGTEYMILGIEGQYRLKTTNEIGGARRDVKTLEQYWKTYNMIKHEMLNIPTSEDAFSTDPTTWVVPENKRADLKTALQRLKYTATDVSNMEYQINAFTSTGVYFFRIGTSSYEYKKVTVTAIATTDPVASAVYTSEGCSQLTWEGPNYVDGWIWHSYEEYANAVRWNGYNDKSDGHNTRLPEKIEHWYQTFDMGNGSFDVETAVIPPVLVLLDRHGWEIMRKPLPDKSSYPYDAERQAVLKAYDSPLVKEYKFYSNASKAYGCHKYALRLDDKKKERDQIKVDGKHFTSTSLADLPPLTASGVLSSGVLNDQYVTYTVKEEYEDNYDYNLTLNKEAKTFTETGTSLPYLVLQDGRFYKTENSDNKSYFSKPIKEHTSSGEGNVYDLIADPVNHGGNNADIIDKDKNWIGNNFWRVMPNLDIDEEMGIVWTSETDTTKLEPYTRYVTKEKYENRTGFDPYNIQLQLINKNNGTADGRFMTTHMTSTSIVNGAMKGAYDEGSGGTVKITLETRRDATNPADANLVHSEGYDHSDIKMTNQTFMAVSDADGNMQLMPRFDHSLRVDLASSNPWETTLKTPKDNGKKASADDNSSMGSQTTFFVRPQRFHYHIIDNFGREALCYKRGGDFYPVITDHFKSPIAKEFTYYKGLTVHGDVTGSNIEEWGSAPAEFRRTATNPNLVTDLINLLPKSGTYYYQIGTRGEFTYKKVTVTKGLLEQEITGSLADANLTDNDCHVYVRYNYDEEADHERDRILQGQWFTVKLANKDLQASGEVMKFTKHVANNDAYNAAKTALSLDGVYYFRIGMNPAAYTYNKVTVSGSGASKEEESISPEIWNNALSLAGLGVDLYAGTKPATIDKNAKIWQWKFLQAPADPSSDYYLAPDPYAVQIFNRNANYTENPSLEPSPMAVGIKVPNAESGADRFALLSHPDGGYALAVAKTYTNYNYRFLNGAAMTTPDAGTPQTATTYIENRQQITVSSEDYETEKGKLSSAIDEEYYFKINNVAYMQVTVTDGTPGTASASTKEAWEGATGKFKKTATNDTDLENQRTKLSENGDYYFKITSSSVTYKKVTVISGVMTETDSDVDEWNSGNYRFTYNTNALSPGSQLLVTNDVVHNFEYKVINNSSKLSVSVNQTTEEAAYHEFFPYLPEAIQTPLLNMEDYKYYGFATPAGMNTPLDSSDDTYTVIPQTLLYTLAGLYDDVVWVRYGAYDVDKTPFKVPNVRNATETGQVARDPNSVDASLNINGELPYNIIWYNDNMMSTATEESTTISNGGSKKLSGDKQYVWYIEGGDPYALKIKHKLTGNYVNGTATLTDEASAKEFMLLKKSGYDYGILQETAGTYKLSEYGQTMVSGDPTKFIIFGLSVHDLIYRLIIAKTCDLSKKSTATTDQYVDIPYSDKNPTPYDPDYNPSTGKLRVYGSTQRDLKSKNSEEGIPGEKYQLGEIVTWGGEGHTYSHHAGAVSIGDELAVPNVFNRPNCTFEYYIQGIYNSTGTTSESALDAKYKGLKRDKLMSDADLIDKTVVVNIVYSFDKSLQTNAGMDFVRSTDDKCWYTFETSSGATPYLAHYTNAWGLQSMEGRATRYTNDYLWTPVGDVYGFKLYNRYMIKNSDGSNKVMTFAGEVGEKNLLVAEPGTGSYTLGNEVFELLTGDNPNSGYFRVHPVVNNSGTQYYVWRDPSTDPAHHNYAKLSTTPSDWTFGLDMSLMTPYYERAGYIGGLTPKGKTAYETAVSSGTIMDIQHVVYDDANIITFTPGYYRLHNQPGVSEISPVRYASGYLHDIEKTAGTSSTAIPMHFYSKAGVKTTFEGEGGLENGFTVTNATRGEIPIVSTEYDPSTIFYINGSVTTSNNTISEGTMSTQGLNVSGNKMTTETGTTFTFIDIGGATLLITDKLDPATRNYFNFNQTYEESSVKMIYDLKFAHEVPTDDAKWCLQPVQKTGTAGNGEMPLKITTNDGGDEYYYSTLYLPYDVLLPADAGGKTYNAYVCKKWYDTGIHPVKVPAVTTPSYPEGKFVPAGTPVIIRTNDDSEEMTLTLPSNAPSAPLPSSSNIFSGKYLEQLLAVDASHDVYTLGLPMKSNVEKAGDYDTSGNISAPLPEFADNGVGFYINATPNKELNSLKANWARNNRYVLHNKIYYRATEEPGSSARSMTRSGVEFVPLIFDDLYEDNQNGDMMPSQAPVGDGCVYDMQGRRVATEQQVLDGTWKQRVSPGIYIINGKKISVN